MSSDFGGYRAGLAGTEAARLARCGDASALALALQASRKDTLSLFALFEAALPRLTVPQVATFNPPLWELGHIGWFQSWWLGRYPACAEGLLADPNRSRLASKRAGADDLYDSSRVPHATRWVLPLPQADATRADLHAQLQQTLNLLSTWPATADRSLYFFRLALLHEDMHHEAALYMAQALGVRIADPRWHSPKLPAPPEALVLAGGHFELGTAKDAGFAFDNELAAHAVQIAPFEIDTQVLRWAEYLPFVAAGGYTDPRFWTPDGDAWRRASAVLAPRYVRAAAGSADGWEVWRGGQWQALAMDEPACHLTQHEALAWCAWAGRRLPTEAEWEHAALHVGLHDHGSTSNFRWGDVWEWTASPFAPYPDFRAHPYRDYSAPWFDGRPVLRGASFMTQPRMRNACYRNFFPAARNDLPAGFRSCTV